MATIDIDIDEYLDEASDYALKSELEKRGFKVIQNNDPSDRDLKLMLKSALQSGMAGRLRTDEVRDILVARSGDNIVDAFEATLAGDFGRAVALIDREFEPETPGLTN